MRRTAVVSLLALFWWMAASVSENFSTTADEIAHLASGHAYWTQHTYTLQPENGILPQRWAALPLLAMVPNFPPPTDPAVRGGDVWHVGFDFFYQLGNAPDVKLGARVRLGAFINLYGCAIGDDAMIGAFVEIQRDVALGARCRVQSHTFICSGVTLEVGQR